MESVKQRLENLIVLWEAGLLTDKELNRRRDQEIELAVAGPSLNKRKLDKIETVAENQEGESREKGPRKRRQVTKVRLSGFEYDEDGDGSLVPVAMRFDEMYGNGDEDSSYTDESEDSTTTSSSSESASASSEEEESSESEGDEAQDTDKWLRQKLYNFSTLAKK